MIAVWVDNVEVVRERAEEARATEIVERVAKVGRSKGMLR